MSVPLLGTRVPEPGAEFETEPVRVIGHVELRGDHAVAEAAARVKAVELAPDRRGREGATLLYPHFDPDLPRFLVAVHDIEVIAEGASLQHQR